MTTTTPAATVIAKTTERVYSSRKVHHCHITIIHAAAFKEVKEIKGFTLTPA